MKWRSGEERRYCREERLCEFGKDRAHEFDELRGLVPQAATEQERRGAARNTRGFLPQCLTGGEGRRGISEQGTEEGAFGRPVERVILVEHKLRHTQSFAQRW